VASRCTLLTRNKTRDITNWMSQKNTLQRFEIVLGRSLNADYRSGILNPDHPAYEGVPMVWTGSAAQTLGLVGQVSPEVAMQVLIHGIGPHGEKLRTKIHAPSKIDTETGESIAQERREGISWLIGVSKTVSLLLASIQPGVRKVVLEAIKKASETALVEFEQQLTVRRGRGGLRSERIQGLLGIKAQYFSNTAGDPHLHTQFVLNASAPSVKDGRWRAIDSNILFSAQRVAEAAFQSVLKEELSRYLSLDENNWIPKLTGSVLTWEIADLLPAKDRFCQAKGHMENIAANLGIKLENATHKQHNLVWNLHRENKQAIAERLEHTLDVAIAAGDDEAEVLRQEWRNRLRNELAALDRIALRAEPTLQANNTLLCNWQEALESCFTEDSKQDSSRVEVNNLTSQLREIVKKTFVASDIMAFFRSYGATLEQSRQMTAQALRYWHEQGSIHFQRDIDPETVIETVTKGMSEDTRLQNQVWGCKGRIIPDELLKRKKMAKRIADALEQETRRKLAIYPSGLTNNQARATQLIGEGRGLVMIEEKIVQAEKSHFLKPVVEAARQEGFDIFILGRNPKLLHELGMELGIQSFTLAKFRTNNPHFEKPTLLIINQANMISQSDWVYVLELAKNNDLVQLVIFGNRFQS
jgi:hypothetical protein